tara:strand:- start:1247 stop:1351 length:105 start_codon:yes stop_codon:yes gene_type:complete
MFFDTPVDFVVGKEGDGFAFEKAVGPKSDLSEAH